MAQKTDVKCKGCGHIWTSHAKLENIAAGKVPCKKCKAKDLVLAQPTPIGEGTPEALVGKPPTDPDAERKDTSLKLAKAKKKLEEANAQKRAADREEYLETELTDEEDEELEDLEKRANSGNPQPPLFPEDMKRLADLRIRSEN